MRSKDYSQEFISNVMTNLANINPELARAVSRRMKQSGLAGMSGFWEELGATVSDGFTDYKDLAVSKEQASIDVRRAEEMAKVEAIRIQGQIELAKAQAESAGQQAELIAQQTEIQKFISEMELNKLQRAGLWIAGGLAAYLAFTMVRRGAF